MEADGSALKEIRFPVTAGLAGHCARDGEVVNVRDAHEDARFNPEFDKQTGYRTRTVLCVPVIGRDGNVTGVTQAINKVGGAAFEEGDVELLKAISAQIAVAVENAQLYARTVSMKNYLDSVRESISNGILTLDDRLQGRHRQRRRSEDARAHRSTGSSASTSAALLGAGNAKLLSDDRRGVRAARARRRGRHRDRPGARQDVHHQRPRRAADGPGRPGAGAGARASRTSPRSGA